MPPATRTMNDAPNKNHGCAALACIVGEQIKNGRIKQMDIGHENPTKSMITMILVGVTLKRGTITASDANLAIIKAYPAPPVEEFFLMKCIFKGETAWPGVLTRRAAR